MTLCTMKSPFLLIRNFLLHPSPVPCPPPLPNPCTPLSYPLSPLLNPLASLPTLCPLSFVPFSFYFVPRSLCPLSPSPPTPMTHVSLFPSFCSLSCSLPSFLFPVPCPPLLHLSILCPPPHLPLPLPRPSVPCILPPRPLPHRNYVNCQSPSRN